MGQVAKLAAVGCCMGLPRCVRPARFDEAALAEGETISTGTPKDISKAIGWHRDLQWSSREPTGGFNRSFGEWASSRVKKE
jgi:hypothetical protein